MAKDFDTGGDIPPDAGSVVSNDAGANSGGDIASNDGVDLNAGDANFAKASVKDRLIAAGLIPVAATGAYAQPNEHVQGILNDPVPGYHQTIDMPPNKTPEDWAAEMGETIREGDPAPEAPELTVEEPMVAGSPPPSEGSESDETT